MLPAISPATATTTAAATTVPAVSSPAAATAAPGALCLGPRLVDVDRAAADLRSIQRSDRFLAIFVARHFYETKAARASGIAIRHNAHAVDLTVPFKNLSKFVFVCTEA
jgi:hypothetical protein